MDYLYLNNHQPLLNDYNNNVYQNHKIKYQNNKNIDLYRNDSILKEKLINKKYNTSKNSPIKSFQDASLYNKDKTQILFKNKIKKIYAKKNNNLNFRDNSANYLLNKNYNKYLINNYNKISNSNFAYNHNLLNYYNNNSIENNNNINHNHHILSKKLNYNDILDQENSYNNIYNNNYIINNEMEIINNNMNRKKYLNGVNNNKRISENKLVKNYNLNNDFKKISKEKIFMKNRIKNNLNNNNNHHQKIKSTEDISLQNKINNNKIYNLKYKKEIPKYILKYNVNNLNNNNNNNINSANNSGINFLMKKNNNYITNQDLNKTNNMNYNINNDINNNEEKNKINNLINSLESYMLLEKIEKKEKNIKLKKILNSNLRKNIKDNSEISNEIGATSSSNIKTTVFSSINNNNINKIYSNDNSISILSKSNNNFNNLIIKDYKTKETKENEIKTKYNSTNNSFNNNKKIYQKKLSSQKEITNNKSIPNIKLLNNKINNNINIVNPNIIYNNNSIIKSKYNLEKIKKNDNNKNNIINNNNSTYKTNEFENKNISEFPKNENIIKENLDEHNNLYINNNNINILNKKNNIEEKDIIKDIDKKKEDNNNIDNNTKEIFKSIQSSDTLINKEKNLEQLNSNNIIKNDINNIDKEQKKIEIKKDEEKEDIILNNNKDNNFNNNKEKKNENKEIIIKDDKNSNINTNIDMNFLVENIISIKEEPKDNNKKIINKNDTIKKEEEKKQIEENNNIEDVNNINNDIKKEKEKDINEIKINEDINIIESSQISQLNNSKTKNKRELHKINEKLNNLYNQDMLCEPSQAKKVKAPINFFDSTKTKEIDYYQKEQQKLSKEIKEFYLKEKKYPKSKLNYYLYGRQIGHGAFGQVNLALHIASGRLVAIKIFAKKNLKNIRAKEKIMTEIETLSNFHHPFINQILDNFETDTHIFIVMEYVCGDLLGFIRKRGKLSESVSKIIFKQLIEGLKYIHKKHFVHRDIKLDNILIDLTNTIKICDFGVSRHFEDKNEIMFDHCGTPAYIAPEIFEHNGYKGPSCDIWSAGVTLYYMLSGEQPFKAGSISELEKIIKIGEFKEIEGVSKEANNLINKILQVNPKNRISADDILNHKWLDKVDLSQRNKLNLFTEAEKILMSKFDVNYLNSDNKSELIENFTLKNIEDSSNNNNKNYGNTKSIIFAPYNTFIDEFDNKDNNNIKGQKNTKNKNSLSLYEENKDYKEIEIQNNICKFGIRVQQLNVQYELSNNGDFDNGLIKTEKQEDFQKENEKIEKMFENKKGKKWKNKEKYDDECEIINVRKDILEKIEKEVGYKTEYIIECIKKNKINYATATYYLLEKDEQFN